MKLAVLLITVVACARSAAPPDAGPADVELDATHAVIKSGSIGDSSQRQSSYVLVDVTNRQPTDRLVAVGGTLLDGSSLADDQLRVPAGATRTFALVADHAVAPGATARLRVVRSTPIPPEDPPVITLSDVRVTHADLTVITARAHNTAARGGTAVVIATFHDASGAILARPFTVVPLASNENAVVRLEGPRGATQADVYVGEVAFQ